MTMVKTPEKQQEAKDYLDGIWDTSKCDGMNFITHENLFPNFYIINLPSKIGIQFIDGVLYIIDRLWKAGLLLENHGKY